MGGLVTGFIFIIIFALIFSIIFSFALAKIILKPFSNKKVHIAILTFSLTSLSLISFYKFSFFSLLIINQNFQLIPFLLLVISIAYLINDGKNNRLNQNDSEIKTKKIKLLKYVLTSTILVSVLVIGLLMIAILIAKPD